MSDWNGGIRVELAKRLPANRAVAALREVADALDALPDGMRLSFDLTVQIEAVGEPGQ